MLNRQHFERRYFSDDPQGRRLFFAQGRFHARQGPNKTMESRGVVLVSASHHADIVVLWQAWQRVAVLYALCAALTLYWSVSRLDTQTAFIAAPVLLALGWHVLRYLCWTRPALRAVRGLPSVVVSMPLDAYNAARAAAATATENALLYGGCAALVAVMAVMIFWPLRERPGDAAKWLPLAILGVPTWALTAVLAQAALGFTPRLRRLPQPTQLGLIYAACGLFWLALYGLLVPN